MSNKGPEDQEYNLQSAEFSSEHEPRGSIDETNEGDYRFYHMDIMDLFDQIFWPFVWSFTNRY